MLSPLKASPFIISLLVHFTIFGGLLYKGQITKKTENKQALDINIISDIQRQSAPTKAKFKNVLKHQKKLKLSSQGESVKIKNNDQDLAKNISQSALSDEAQKRFGNAIGSYFDYLRSAIDQNKKYPVRAKRLGQEGTVVVLLKIQKDGSLGNIKIKNSSSSRILDQAAVNLIKKSAPFKSLPEYIQNNDFEIPIQWFL